MAQSAHFAFCLAKNSNLDSLVIRQLETERSTGKARVDPNCFFTLDKNVHSTRRTRVQTLRQKKQVGRENKFLQLASCPTLEQTVGNRCQGRDSLHLQEPARSMCRVGHLK